MSKRNHIVERASDVNGGQYIQTNPSYNSGYEDGKRAGKEYCASEITTLRKQVEKLTNERETLAEAIANAAIKVGIIAPDTALTGPHLLMLCNDLASSESEQLAALAEQNKKLREALIDTAYFLEQHSNRWDGIKGKHPNDVVEAARNALSSPDLASPVLNRIRAEGMRMAAETILNSGALEDGDYVLAIRAKADELENGK